MRSTEPKKIAINHDDYHAAYIGRTSDARQFFLTTPFEPALSGRPGCEYIALFLFDLAGNFRDAIIDTLGPRGSYPREEKIARLHARLDELGEVSFERIEIKPFSVCHNDVEMGLIARTFEGADEQQLWAVELLPGNFMAFFEPWDSGYYDT